jgi:ABC-type sulfate/molybdate transport systems ATPase subunit
MDLLKVSGIFKQEERGFALSEISFTQQAFQRIAIAGETGSGKSTVLKIIAGLIQPDGGEVLFEQKRVRGPEEKLIPGHPSIAYLSQHFELRNNYTVAEELDYTNKLGDEQAHALYALCKIDHLLNRKTNQLSGGERQRIVLCRLLIATPRLLLLDEPFSNLDMVHRNILKSVIRDISDELKITCMLVSHDPLDVLSWADEIIVMKDGSMIQQGTPQQVYVQPVNEYVAGLFGNYNLISAEQALHFFGLPQNKIKSNSIVVRPENIMIMPPQDGAVAGVVNHVNFLGAYYEVDVWLEDMSIKLATKKNYLRKGDIIHIALAPNGIWYI